MISEEKIVKKTEKFFRENIPKTRENKSYLFHVMGARKYALLLAEKYNANKFIIEVSALLHDVGADAGKGHSNESARIAKDFLLEFNISENILKKIIKCIKNHSMGMKTDSLEEQIIQDADGIIFLEDTFKYFYYKRKNKPSSSSQSKKWTTNKINGMMKKIKTREGIKIATKLLPKTLKWVEVQK